MTTVAIIGAGRLGRALEKLLRANGVGTALWDRNPERTPDMTLEKAVRSADQAMFCVPSWSMREAVTSALPFLRPKAVVFSYAKGIEADSLKTMSELLEEVLSSNRPFVVAGGPMMAEEILDGGYAAGVFGSASDEALRQADKLLSAPNFRVETTNDAASVAWAGVLKNIYSVLLGVADGLELVGNEKGWLTAQAFTEMTDLAAEVGADTRVILGAAGLGDLIATGYSPYSRNRQVGHEIVETGQCALRSEGLNALPLLVERLGARAEEFPILNLTKEIAADCKPARAVYEAFRKKY